MSVELRLDPEFREVIAAMPSYGFDWASVSIDQIPDARARLRVVRPPLDPALITSEVRDVSVPGPDGAPEVALRIYRPKGGGSNLPCIYWVHGGGYFTGSAMDPDARLDRWVSQIGCVAVSVEYRLAPETPFPGPLDDVHAGLQWVANNPSELGIDASKLAIGGGSAGGGLAAGLALLVRDRGEIPVIFQLLVYPMIDDRFLTVSSTMDTIGWTVAASRLGWSAYLGVPPGSDGVSPYAAPARAEDLSGLPPAFVCVGDLDIFRDEDIEYARRLSDAGVPTELHVYPGVPHAFENSAPEVAVSRHFSRDITDALGTAFARAGS
jgi:acetyl esterase/lipase